MKAIKQDLILGIDVGTSSVKAGLFDRAGALHGTGRARLPLLLPQDGWAEQQPTMLWQGVADAVQDLLQHSGVPGQRIAALGVTAQTCGCIPVDEHGEALHNGLIWLDTRSTPQAQQLMGGFPSFKGYGARQLLRWLYYTNGAPNLSGKDALTKMLWFREQYPELQSSTQHFLDIKDYLLLRLCGRVATTYDCAHLTWLMDNRPGRWDWSPQLLRHTGLDRALLPELVSGTEILGALKDGPATELGLPADLPVVAGASDVYATALGSGAVDPGQAHLYLGTSSWSGVPALRRRIDPASGIATLCGIEPGSYLLLAAQETAGGCVEWACEQLGLSHRSTPDRPSFDDLASRAPVGSKGLLFLPWLMGERVPADDTRLRGGYLNLSLSHGRAELTRAVLEGVACNIRWAFDRLAQLARPLQGTVKLVGGGASSDLWSQILADTLGRPLERTIHPNQAGARGVAMTAAVAIGWYPSLAAAAAMCPTDRVFEPAPQSHRIMDQQYANFLTAYKQLRPWYRRRHDVEPMAKRQ
ncbi:MAG: FGGY-family carbohydrate kinase [Sedimenticola sp.]